MIQRFAVHERGSTVATEIRAGVATFMVMAYMMSLVADIRWDEPEEAIPAFVTMLVMPFTWSITNGIGAGFVSYTAIKVLGGKARDLHPMVYLASAAFLVYFALPLIERTLR